MGWSATLLPVQATLGDVLHHAVGDQVPDRLTGRDPGPAGSRGDRQRRDLDQAAPQREVIRSIPEPG